ncbi:hypothetical protein [Pseudonocardia oroxyli]|uniref:Asp23 family, cell envelope-related function n=1 Tax=Pseudonocardia oroxyli TaxID=366584 RepID=A0A1G7PVN4_PSEOR|nr:hypothetical protein [Pseudonocardia oroxyli]SDF90334.1 hypothetical protein SAMN05216377_107252 [Pseudonocardia oroxyli]
MNDIDVTDMNDTDIPVPPESGSCADTTHQAAAAVAAAVRACPLVAGLHPGDRDHTRTDHPDRDPVLGVRLDAGTVVVGVVGYHPTRVEDLARAVRRAVRGLHPDADVTVCVEDMLPTGPEPQ